MRRDSTVALDFERPLVELEAKIATLKSQAGSKRIDLSKQVSLLEKRAEKLQQKIYQGLSRWQVVQLSRHPQRPYFLDYLGILFTDFCELAGDRHCGEDESIVAGFARFDGFPVLVMGHQKGRGTKENMRRNFGMPMPEGYRKARRLMELAERFQRPVFTFVDTPGAYPGIGAEERGQAEAIAVSLETMCRLQVPIISTVIGEGGSGGALAIGIGNRVLMLENSTYSVISPEACSSILYRDGTRAEAAAEGLKLTARDLHAFKIVDEVIPEPPGGAHRDPTEAARLLQASVRTHFQELRSMTPKEWVDDRYNKFRAMGVFTQ